MLATLAAPTAAPLGLAAPKLTVAGWHALRRYTLDVASFWAAPLTASPDRDAPLGLTEEG